MVILESILCFKQYSLMNLNLAFGLYYREMPNAEISFPLILNIILLSILL